MASFIPSARWPRTLELVRLWQITVFFTLSGCIALPIPHDDWLTGQHTGRITDAVSQTPISGAKVTLYTLRGRSQSISTLSDAEGLFSIGPIVDRETFFEIWMPPAETVCQDMLTFQHPQYQISSILWSSGLTNPTGGPCRNIKGKHDVPLAKAKL